MLRYEVKPETRDGFEVYVLRDHERQAHAVIIPELGCNCVEFRATPDEAANETATDARNAADAVDVFVPPASIAGLRDVPFTGGNPILFPFPNRVRDGAYTFEEQTYRMERLLATGWDKGAGQAIHGLVGDKPWTVKMTTATGERAEILCALVLSDFPDILEQYPFPCHILVSYILSEGVLTMITMVTNTGENSLPMGFGIHPWFPTSLQTGAKLPAGLHDIPSEQRAQAQVHVPSEAIWELDKLMPTGKVVPVSEAGKQFDLRHFAPLAEYFFDHVFTNVQRRADGWSEGGLRDPQSGLEMYLAADPAFREWVLYAPLDSPVIALEPYTCTTDAVNLQTRGIDAGLISLQPGQTWRGELRFGLRRFHE